MFNLKKQNAKLANVNPRSELHGEERVPACDLSIEITVNNEMLDEFHPDLRASLFRIGSAKPQAELDMEPGRLTGLRFPQMTNTIKWDHECAGYTAVVHDGLDGGRDMRMPDCKVDKFEIDPLDGGSVVIKFRVTAHPDEAQRGRLTGMIQDNVEFSLLPPEVKGDQQSLDTEQHQDADAEVDA